MENAMEKIMSISQEGTVHDYYVEFEFLFNQVKISEEISEFYAIYLFICGLKPEIKKIFARWHQYSCHTVEDVISLALKIDANELQDSFSLFDPKSSFYIKDLVFDFRKSLAEIMEGNESFKDGKIQEISKEDKMFGKSAYKVFDEMSGNVRDETNEDMGDDLRNGLKENGNNDKNIEVHIDLCNDIHVKEVVTNWVRIHEVIRKKIESVLLGEMDLSGYYAELGKQSLRIFEKVLTTALVFCWKKVRKKKGDKMNQESEVPLIVSSMVEKKIIIKLLLNEITRGIHTDQEWKVMLLRYFNILGAHENGKLDKLMFKYKNKGAKKWLIKWKMKNGINDFKVLQEPQTCLWFNAIIKIIVVEIIESLLSAHKTNVLIKIEANCMFGQQMLLPYLIISRMLVMNDVFNCSTFWVLLIWCIWSWSWDMITMVSFNNWLMICKEVSAGDNFKDYTHVGSKYYATSLYLNKLDETENPHNSIHLSFDSPLSPFRDTIQEWKVQNKPCTDSLFESIGVPYMTFSSISSTINDEALWSKNGYYELFFQLTSFTSSLQDYLLMITVPLSRFAKAQEFSQFDFDTFD